MSGWSFPPLMEWARSFYPTEFISANASSTANPRLSLPGTYGLISVQKVSSQLRITAPIENQTTSETTQSIRFYSGINFSPNISAHYLYTGLTQGSEFDTRGRWDKRRIENMFLQIGNSYLSRNHLSIGRIDLPFGLNDRPLEYISHDEYQQFWLQRIIGYRITRKT